MIPMKKYINILRKYLVISSVWAVSERNKVNLTTQFKSQSIIPNLA